MQHKHTGGIKQAEHISEAARDFAGKGIKSRSGKQRKARFVEIFHHTMSEASAFYFILLLVAAVFLIPFTLYLFIETSSKLIAHPELHNLTLTLVVFGLDLAFSAALIVGLFLLAHRIFTVSGAHRVALCGLTLLADTAVIMCHLMVFGISLPLILYGLIALLLIALHSYWDPQLADERANRKTQTESLHDMLHDSRDERTVEKGKVKGHGYITLNFFNLFWIFTICSVLGLVIETIFFYAIHGYYMNRTGMLFGPFSPIYGFGGLLMTIALNRLHNRNIILIFIISALIGGAFEYFTSWYMQTAFGVTAWNYSGTFLSIGGRTNFFFMCCWGLLGVAWIKLALPIMLYFIKKIPWGWRYTLTTICAILMFFDGFITITTLDCWYLREAGVPVSTPIERYCAVHYDNEFMKDRFQTMTMNVDSTARTNTLDTQ